MKHAPRKATSSWNRAGCRENGRGNVTRNRHGRGDWSRGDQRKKTARHEFVDWTPPAYFKPRGI